MSSRLVKVHSLRVIVGLFRPDDLGFSGPVAADPHIDVAASQHFGVEDEDEFSQFHLVPIR